MKSQKITVELWTEIDDDRAAHLNGGSMSLAVYGTLGAVQQTGDRQAQVNIFSNGKAYGQNYYSVYTYYPGYGYYNTQYSY
ncbi:hypothetical protein [Chamaesiphon sp. VAR_69_metabat_338]|uniref:hypothetical protein n=1 Tax=Chamaesiphon sp. VAR_69_metabat_338 TaxID=2964704 RepID=UPI00286EA88D|nr:hypothetical protein [Chamaesiphon sp. VAR_69_metabat_338]